VNGGFINGENLQLQDLHYFNAQASPILLNRYQDAFHLKEYYSLVTPEVFAEAHVMYTTPYLFLKRLPGFSRTLLRENLSADMLWTPYYGFYTEAGYSISEIFFMAEVGFYAGFRNLKYESMGFRLILSFR